MPNRHRHVRLVEIALAKPDAEREATSASVELRFSTIRSALDTQGVPPQIYNHHKGGNVYGMSRASTPPLMSRRLVSRLASTRVCYTHRTQGR